MTKNSDDVLRHTTGDDGSTYMCLIFLKPKNASNYLTYDRFCNAIDNNHHSIGVMFKDSTGSMVIERYLQPETHKEELYKLIEDKDEIAIHFRNATHGLLSLENTHPFVIHEGLFMMHNGVIHDYCNNPRTDYSDTKNFVEYFLKPYIAKNKIDVIKDKTFLANLEKTIGHRNKLLFIDNDFNYAIVNESSGVWRDGCWLSKPSSVLPQSKNMEFLD